jgi:hypothetical protein
MDINVLIIGAGMYGCHTANLLLKLGINFKIIDKENDFFLSSSSKNQNRLHMGFHYPRSYNTRHECIDGYIKFIKKYSFAIQNIPNNYYFIEKKSIIDYTTYKNIYNFENIPFHENTLANLPFKYNKDMFDKNAILVNEKFINFKELQKYFTSLLSKNLIKDYDENKLNINNNIIYDNEEFTHLFDCTYLRLNISSKLDVFYELCIVFLYEQIDKTETFGFTIMDGPFLSLYPYNIENNIYSLTSVLHLPIFKSKNINLIYKRQQNIIQKDIIINRQLFEYDIIKYIPDFKKLFKYNGFFTSIKTKKNNINNDDRSYIYEKINNKIHRFSGGKITGIFNIDTNLYDIFVI